MTILVFVLALVVLALGLQSYAQNHALDGLEAGMMPEDVLAEPGRPARLHLTLRNRKGWPRLMISLKLHLNQDFAIQDADFVQKDLMGGGRSGMSPGSNPIRRRPGRWKCGFPGGAGICWSLCTWAAATFWG